jgi:hypothetical protein
MTPKEKAKELVDKFHRLDPDTDYYNGITVELAKQCSLIAVDEVIEQNNIWINQTGKGTNNYWQEVKQEINKL